MIIHSYAIILDNIYNQHQLSEVKVYQCKKINIADILELCEDVGIFSGNSRCLQQGHPEGEGRADLEMDRKFLLHNVIKHMISAGEWVSGFVGG